ncbi:MAG: MFS transporter [Proteobacteria bacterium]|nr:MAG: MFS transporter [Pseudomonadota bacterium]
MISRDNLSLSKIIRRIVCICQRNDSPREVLFGGVSQTREISPLGRGIIYGLPALPLALIGVCFFVYLPKFYADELGLSLYALGAIIMASRVLDGVLDPLIGAASDRTCNRMGRRRPWLLFSVLPFALVNYLLLVPPALAPAELTLWVGVLSILFFIFWTMLAVPYEAWGLELSRDYDRRTALLSVRDGFLILGTLLAALLPESISYLQGSSAIGETLRSLVWIHTTLLLTCVVLCCATIPEREAAERAVKAPSIFSACKEAFSNKAFRILLLAYLLGGFGSALPATLIFFYVEYVLRSANAGVYLLIYFAVGFICVPLWVKLAKLTDKKRAWIAALIVNTGAFSGVMLLGAGDEVWYGVLVAVSGIGYGAGMVLPSSMQADVMDLDELDHGARREGQFVGLWLIARKLAAAFGAGIALPVLSWWGYVPNSEQSEGALWGLTFLYAGVPCICYAAAITAACFYPLSRERHAEVAAKLALRRDASSTVEVLE